MILFLFAKGNNSGSNICISIKNNHGDCFPVVVKFSFQIPYTTNRKPVFLIVVVPVYVAVIVVQVAVPGVICIVLRRTPPVTVDPNVVEFSIVVTVATRKGCKSNHLLC